MVVLELVVELVVDFTVVDEETGTEDVATVDVVVSEAVIFSARISWEGNPAFVSAGTKAVGKVGNALVMEEPLDVENLSFLMTTVT